MEGLMPKIKVQLEEQAAADLHALVVHVRRSLPDDDDMHPRLRDAELALAGALRAVGWMPRQGGGWLGQTMQRPR
jgi:hypothetical protein